jgi:subtilisin family serine protease
MMINSRSLIGVLALIVSAAPLFAQPCAGENPCVDPSTPGRVSIRIKDGYDTQAVLNQIRALYPGAEIEPGRMIEAWRMYSILLPNNADECAAQGVIEDALAQDPRDPEDPSLPLRWVEAGYSVIASEGHTGSVFDSRHMPYEANYSLQYAVGQLNIDGAHNYSRGAGVTVAVLDTGIDAGHPALAGFVRDDGVNIIRENDRAADDTRDIGDGWMTGHGTFVAGLIRLTAPESQLLPIVVLRSDGSSDCFTVAQGLYTAVASGATIINCSLGTTYDSLMFQDALLIARDLGITVVGAAGNRGLNIPPALNCTEFPGGTQFERRQQADIRIGIAVSAIRETSERVSSSSYYPEMWLAASGGSTPLPGSPDEYDPTRSIISTLPDNDYGVWEGTSFACAFVSGGAALLHAQHPFWPADASTNENVRNLMQSTGVNIDSQNPGFAGQIGRRLDLSALLRADIPGDLDHDGDVDLQDLANLLAHFAQVGDTPGDIDGDGAVTLQDLAFLLASYGG